MTRLITQSYRKNKQFAECKYHGLLMCSHCKFCSTGYQIYTVHALNGGALGGVVVKGLHY